jgi:hypothetical protein
VTDASFCLSPLRAYMNVLNISFLFLPSLSSTVYGMRLYAHPPGGTITTPPGTLNRANAHAQSGATQPRGDSYA